MHSGEMGEAKSKNTERRLPRHTTGRATLAPRGGVKKKWCNYELRKSLVFRPVTSDGGWALIVYRSKAVSFLLFLSTITPLVVLRERRISVRLDCASLLLGGDEPIWLMDTATRENSRILHRGRQIAKFGGNYTKTIT